MTDRKTPLLDELEKGPWPSFVKEIKKSAKSPMVRDLLGQLERSYTEKIGHWKHGGLVGVKGYGGGVIGRYNDLPNEFPERWLKQWVESIQPSLGDWDWRPRLPSLGIPVLLVWGQAERGPRELEREWLESLRDGHLHVVPEAGHWPFCENPDAFFPAVEAFLAGPARHPAAPPGRVPRTVA